MAGLAGARLQRSRRFPPADPSPNPSTEAFGLAQDEATHPPSCWAARSACRSMRRRLHRARPIPNSRPQCVPECGTLGPGPNPIRMSN